ncbi:MAG: MauE/DoxX family redox-associated membrane protein [Candidatus Komeilibacteria bacterium]
MLDRWSSRLAGLSGFFLRCGLGFVYLFSGYSKLFAGSNGIGVCTNRVEAVTLVANYQYIPIDPGTFVIIQSVLEIVLGLILLLGWKIRWAGLISVILLLLFFLLLDFQLIWKNMALLGASLALVVTKENRWSLDRRLSSK